LEVGKKFEVRRSINRSASTLPTRASFNEAVLVAKVAKTFGLFSSKNETLGEFRYDI
jgi:hypothetical protein